jgi:hypothetical protein
MEEVERGGVVCMYRVKELGLGRVVQRGLGDGYCLMNSRRAMNWKWSSPEQSDEAYVPIPPMMPDNPDALFANELCYLLNSLEATITGCGRVIACLLMGTAIKGKSNMGVWP